MYTSYLIRPRGCYTYVSFLPYSSQSTLPHCILPILLFLEDFTLVYPSYPSRSRGLYTCVSFLTQLSKRTLDLCYGSFLPLLYQMRLHLYILPTLVVLDEVTPHYPSYPCCPNEVAPVNNLFPRRSWWTLRLSIFSKLVVLKDVTPVNHFR